MKRADLIAVAALWVCAYLAGAWYVGAYRAGGGAWDGALTSVGAAVSLACGRGYVDPHGPEAGPYVPPVNDFLAGRTDEVSCADLPRVLSGEPTVMQRLYRYLIATVAIVWKVRGRITWSGLVPLYGVLYACTIIAAYAIFRQLLETRLAATLAAVALMVSSIHLTHLPLYRDYAKAPLILALIAIMLRIARGPHAPRRLLQWGALFGLVLGIGLGFRNDLLVNLPPFVLVVFLWTGESPFRQLRLKLATLAIAAAVFVAASWPVLHAYAQGSNSGHAAVSGLMSNTFDEPLGIRPSLYDWAYVFQDDYTYAVIASFGYRANGKAPAFGTREYDSTASAYLAQIVRHTPADVLAHAYGSTIRMLEMPYTAGLYANAIPEHAERNAFARAVYAGQAWLLGALAGKGTIIAAAALILGAVSSMPAALTALALLFYYAGYPILQFQHRHYFHLEFIGWLALAFLIESVIMWTRALIRKRERGERVTIGWRLLQRGLVYVAISGVLIVGVLAVLRVYQQSHLTALFASYLDAPRERVDLSPSQLWATRGREAAATPVSAQYLVVELGGRACEAARLPVTFRYISSTPMADFSRTVDVAIDQNVTDPTRVLFPAYDVEGLTHLERIELPAGYESCLAGVSRIADLKTHPLLVDAALRPEWRRARLFETLSAVESDRRTMPAYFTSPAELVVPRHDLQRVPADAGERTNVVIRQRVMPSTARVLQMAPRAVSRGSVLVATGDAHDGAFRVGLVDGQRWVAGVVVTSGGPFVAAVESPEDGRFGIAVDAELPDRFPAKYAGRRLGPLLQWFPGATYWMDATIEGIGLAARSKND